MRKAVPYVQWALVGSVMAAACTEQPSVVAPDLRARSSVTEATGNISVVFKSFENNGGIVERRGTASVGPSAGVLGAGPSTVTKLLLQAESRSQRPANLAADVPTFGLVPQSATRNRQLGMSLRIPTRRVASRKQDGHTVDLFTVAHVDRSIRTPVGMIASVDGKASVFVEFESFVRGRPTVARVTQLAASGQVLSATHVDMRDVSLQGRLAVRDSDGLRRSAHRLLRGLSNLVLPDVLHAQQVEDDPCAGTEQFLAGTLAALAVAVVGTEVAAAGCLVALPFCAAYIVAQALTGIAAALAWYALVQFNECRVLHPHCFQGGYMTNGSCDAPSTATGSGSGVGGGSSGTGETGGTGDSGAGGSGDISCYWDTWWGPGANGTLVTYSGLVCI